MRALVFVVAALTVAAQPPAPEARARQFLDLLSKRDGAGAAAMLDEQVKGTLTAPQLGQIWTGLTRQMGAFQRFGESRIEAWDTADAIIVVCEFEKAKLDARIPVTKPGLIAGLKLGLHVDYAPPTYVNASSFTEKDVTIGSGEWAVHGTLTLPNGPGPFRALVLVHGSGSYDRDYSIGPNKLFRDIAWGVASRGVAVLRYNKRPFEHDTAFAKLTEITTKEEATDDAVLAAALLRKTPGIDAQHVFVLGHSLGGTLAPRIARADPSVAGLIIAGGAATPLLDMIVPQMIHNFTINGPMTPAMESQVEKMKQQIALAKDPKLPLDTPPSKLPLGAQASYWIDLREYRPPLLARDCSQPMLIMQFDRDYQVTLDDFAEWRKALSARKNVELKRYPGLSHIMIAGEGPSSDAEYEKPGHVAAAVIEDIATFVKKQ
jgi:dienelactone hydrolase